MADLLADIDLDSDLPARSFVVRRDVGQSPLFESLLDGGRRRFSPGSDRRPRFFVVLELDQLLQVNQRRPDHSWPLPENGSLSGNNLRLD